MLIRRVSGESMLPTLQPGSIIFATGWYRKLEVGDIIIMRLNQRDIIKRVTLTDKAHVYVLGDNRDASTDSREFGWINQSTTVGRVFRCSLGR